MARAMKRCLQVTLKVLNAAMGLLGIAMIIYGIWMIRVWERDIDNSSSVADDDDDAYALPWLIHAFVGVGIALCAITFLGHMAAGTANSWCLSCYSFVVFVLLILDTALLADVLLNSDWEEDLPDDPSGRFDDFKDFVSSNMQLCQWVSFSIFLAQGCSILIATIIKSLDADERINYDTDSDVEHGNSRAPFLNPPAAQTIPTFAIGEPQFVYYKYEDRRVTD
ncbi:tetraspanin-19-like [Coffea arabica]|uniref:Tetraspanin-19-like n=1 Tax=Coffea arabica TaxID=13443 RepID=A0A6P6WCL1_COFAR|nr:tetraspanin-19-like [Coffea arabica]